jgi:hypothetical protein
VTGPGSNPILHAPVNNCSLKLYKQLTFWTFLKFGRNWSENKIDPKRALLTSRCPVYKEMENVMNTGKAHWVRLNCKKNVSVKIPYHIEIFVRLSVRHAEYTELSCTGISCSYSSTSQHSLHTYQTPASIALLKIQSQPKVIDKYAHAHIDESSL